MEDEEKEVEEQRGGRETQRHPCWDCVGRGCLSWDCLCRLCLRRLCLCGLSRSCRRRREGTEEGIKEGIGILKSTELSLDHHHHHRLPAWSRTE